MTRDEALQKIKKCLALASSPNAHEAAAALRQAQKMMQQFGLNEVDIGLADVAERDQEARNVPLVRWESLLANMVASAFGCTVITRIGTKYLPGLKLRRIRKWVFIGVGAAPEIAGYAFDVLSRQCAKDRRAYIKQQSKNCKPKTKVARGDGYAEGWLDGVYAELESFAATPEQQAIVARYMEQKYPNLKELESKDRITGKNVTSNDWYMGKKAGSAVRLKHGVGGQQQALLMSQR
ncbi:DUF2786 domain-containing protein [Comamonas koreensis]|uniref:DUF2786 domain-containing protein n=1 Tax=Comamonas koreensis TaxID=160825 RepID=A0AAW4XU67_9BURK|nr:DUF2786 domain-containing protein [Comamonas koreensis]MCD2164685.1 DUF2786 domain-containing protein [Comamonas koreensis]